jgi:hypothetical protein
MSDSAHAITFEAESTEVRFRLRSLLIVMAVVAVAATILGWFLRRFPNSREQLLIYWGILSLLLVAICVLKSWRRYRAEKKAGRIMCQLTPHSYFFPRSSRVAAASAGATLLSIGAAMWLFNSFLIADENWGAAFSIVWNSFYMLLILGSGITCFWWRRSIRICDHGVVVREKFLPWDKCRWFYWDAGNRDVIVIEWRGASRIAAQVPPKRRDNVESLLRAKTGKEADETR